MDHASEDSSVFQLFFIKDGLAKSQKWSTTDTGFLNVLFPQAEIKSSSISSIQLKSSFEKRVQPQGFDFTSIYRS